MQNFVLHGDAFVFPVCKCVADVMVREKDVECGVETGWRPSESGPAPARGMIIMVAEGNGRSERRGEEE